MADAQTEYWLTEAARIRQGMPGVPGDQNSIQQYTSPKNIGPINRGLVKIEPNSIVASDDGGTTSAGTSPALGRFQFGHHLDGEPIVIKGVGQEPSEMFEIQNLPALIMDKENQRQLIKAYKERVWDRLPTTRASKALMEIGRQLVKDRRAESAKRKYRR